MAETTIMIAGRSYPMACEDGQEPRLEALAARLDGEARALSTGAPQISETRLMLMVALMVVDKLDEAETALAAAPPAPDPQPGLFATAEAEEAVARLEATAAYLEDAVKS